ncbi:hypothetical protein D3C73_1619460 [compost metagenome]
MNSESGFFCQQRWRFDFVGDVTKTHIPMFNSDKHFHAAIPRQAFQAEKLIQGC